MRTLNLFFAILVSTLKIQSQIPTYVSTVNLVAFYDFNGNANDITMSANHGTVNGAVLSSDRASNPNSAYSFNGSSYISVPSGTATSLNVSNDLSLSFWFKTNQTSDQSFVSFGDNISGTGGYLTSLNGGGIGGNKLTAWSVSPWFSSTLTINDDVWHHAFLSKNSGTLELYVDNVYQATENNANVNSSWGGTRSIGSWNNFAGGFYNGSIDEIGVWDRVLSACERSALFLGVNSVVSLSTTSQMICLGNTATLVASGSNNYTWQPGASNSSSIVISPTVTTVYTVSATNSITGCTSGATTSILVVICNGIEESGSNSEGVYTVYPSPFNERISIHINDESLLQFKIFDVEGKQLLNEQVQTKVSLSTSQFSDGIYFYTISNEKRMIKKGKIIKLTSN